MDAAQLTRSLEGRYSIERELGAGGMATVFLARDLKHNRRVAVKVLREDIGAVLGVERFLSEIQVTANLQHPNLLPLFDSGEAGGQLFYVMPYVEGESLRARLDREKQLPIPEALRIATAVASALDYAHRRGVIHRDLKPDNVLLHEGQPLVADFGIALAVSNAGGTRITQTGVSLGTPHYMSPEQATGDRVDARTDIYSLGAMTYEMLVGDPPHTGSTAQSVISRMLTEPVPSIRAMRPNVPEHVEAAVERALEKLPADRFASAQEFADGLAGRGDSVTTTLPSRAVRGRGTVRDRAHGLRYPLGAVALAAVAVVAVSADRALMRGGYAAGAQTQFTMRLGTPGLDPSEVAISRDGRRIAYVAPDSQGVHHVMVRELSSAETRAVAGTGGAVSRPVFTPDGAWIAFRAQDRLYRVPLSGGPPVLIADSVAAHVGVAWLRDGSVIFSAEGGLARVRDNPIAHEAVTRLDTARREFAHWTPSLLPGERAIIYTSYATPISRARIEAYDLRSGQTKVLVEGGIYPRYVAGHLLYVRDGAIFAVPFDARRLEVRGAARPVVENVASVVNEGFAAYDVSENGTLVYVRASHWNVPNRVVWMDRDGRERPAIPESGPWAEPRLSPDGRWIALSQTSPRREVWLYDLVRGGFTRVARAEGAAFGAVWEPNGRSIVYTHEAPVYDLYRVPADGSAPARPLVESSRDKYASGISPDGRFLLYLESGGGERLRVAPLRAGAEWQGPEWTSTDQRLPVFSPDGRWIAFEEGVLRDSEIFLVAADGSGSRRKVSVDGGAQPRWTRGGREIVYLRGDAMMAVPIDPATGEAGRPAELFRAAIHRGLDTYRTHGYDVTPDGSRFLVVTPVRDPAAQPAVVVLNWAEQLRGGAVLR